MANAWCQWCDDMGSQECPCLSSQPRDILRWEAVDLEREAVDVEGEDHLLLDLTKPEIAIDAPSNEALGALLGTALAVRDSKPNCHASTFKNLGYKEIVAEAELLLFKRACLRLELIPPWDRVFFTSIAEGLLAQYQANICLNCSSLVREIDQEYNRFDICSRILREFLAQCDLAGEPIPSALRVWSANSRFTNPPARPKGKPRDNWYRDGLIVITVATLAYWTSKIATRNDETEPRDSICDAVACAFQRNGYSSINFTTVKRVWLNKAMTKDRKPIGPSILKRWRAEDSATS